MVGLIVGAAILGIIIAVMESGDFPGWGPTTYCVLAAVIPATIINAILPPDLFAVGIAVGAVGATIAIALQFGMSVKRSATAAGIWFAIQIAISTVSYFVLRTK